MGDSNVEDYYDFVLGPELHARLRGVIRNYRVTPKGEQMLVSRESDDALQKQNEAGIRQDN